MRICLDARNPSFGGTYTYIVSLLTAMAAAKTGHELLVLYDDHHGPLHLDGVDERVIPGRTAVRMTLWNKLGLGRLLAREKIDLYHSLKQPSLPVTRARTVYTIHATNQFIHPKLWKRHELAYWRWGTRSCARSADVLIAMSQQEKENLVRYAKAPAEKVDVIHLAPGKRFQPVTDPALLDETCRKYDLPEHFVLFVGNIYPFKNVLTIVRAFHQAIRRERLPHKLVLAGGHGSDSGQVFDLVRTLGITDRVIAPGFVDRELPALYTLADLFLFPSIYESFGLSPLEAMSCGTPVITSNAGALPEIVGEAAIQVDPRSYEMLAREMVRVLGDRQLHRALSRKGLARAATFNWDACARKTVAGYERIMSRC
jgi:glycosyltransferase involved in cell wall biosynthesis